VSWLTANNRLGLLDNLLTLGQNQLNVAWVGHVWVDLKNMLDEEIVIWETGTYTTMCTVCSSALLGSLVDLDVLNDQVTGIETLGVGVCLSVLEETEEELGGLDWPSGTGDTELLACISVNIPPCDCDRR